MDNSKQRTKVLAEYLRINPQIAKLSCAAQEALARHARIIHFARDELVLTHGEEMRFAGVILRGGLRSTVCGYEGQELSMSVLRRGAFYGWVGLMAPTPSPWDMYAQGPTELLAIQMSDFRHVMKTHLEFNAIVAEALSAKLRKAFNHMSILTLDTLEDRLRRTLVMLAGDREMFDKSNPPSIKITQESLGGFVRCSRPTVNRLLRELEQAGLIRLAYGEIIIPDLERLYPLEQIEAFHLH